MVNKIPTALITALAATSLMRCHCQPPIRNLASDTWVATDALGRVVPSGTNLRKPNHPRQVGIFYFLWHGYHGTPGPFDNSDIISDPSHHSFGDPGTFHWWGEPAVGYFRSDDPWVQRKNLQMLADAGVDVLILDVTNAFTYHKELDTLLAAAEDLKSRGNAVPKFAFITHAAPGSTVTDLYKVIYGPGKNRDLWYLWDGKPLILGYKNGKMNDGSPMDPKIVNFFTWRESWAWDHGQDKWQWIDKYPQFPAWHTVKEQNEEVPVSIAGHPIDSLGRSYRSSDTWGRGVEPDLNSQYLSPDTAKGLQFSQQWARALQLDPDFIFVTGWNEWVAQRFIASQPAHFAGHDIKAGDSTFVDEYNAEFSRDAMPMLGGFGDDYYMQLVDGIRKYKGTAQTPAVHTWTTMPAKANFGLWQKVGPVFLDAAGDTTHRDWNGWGTLHYSNNTGRNDFIEARVACDRANVYFYVKTTDPITAHTGKSWMQLLIKTDTAHSSGWNGYQYVLNQTVLSKNRTVLTRFSDNHKTQVRYTISGNQMQITVPRISLGLTDLRKTKFDFHWIDNVRVGPGGPDLTTWWYDGDSAPDGRFNYEYTNTSN